MKKAFVFPAIAVVFGITQVSYAGENNYAVFAMTNSASHNQVLSFSRQSNGSLKPYGTYDTGGRGSGGTTDPLGSQGSLTLSDDHSLLFAVNAGSGQISSFFVDGPKLELADVKSSGGAAPVAVAEHAGLLYVLNFAGNSDVVGFKVDDGQLKMIAGSERFLSTANSGASSLAFSTDGKFLLVTEKLTNLIDVFPVNPDGTLGTVVTTTDPSAGLFDLLITPSNAVISLQAAAESASPFIIEPSGSLTALTAPVPTLGSASCWLAISPNGQWLYTSNAGSANISGFAVTGAGMLSPVPGTIAATMPHGSANLDITVSGDSKYVYALDSGTGSIDMMSIQKNGSLLLIGTLPALTPASGANGIAAL